LIDVDNIVMRFGGIAAVDGCTFGVPDGSITGLIGPNGAGKTTMFNIIGGRLRPDAGRVRFKGEDVTGLAPHLLFAKGLVRTFQIPHEFARMTVLENLAVVPPGQSGESLLAAWLAWRKVARQETQVRARAREVLSLLKLDHLAEAPAGSLSGGQKKLLELGRAIMSGARTILLDEPAAGVNRTLLATLDVHIRALNAVGYTFLVIEHDLDFVGTLCAPIHVMAAGRILMTGTMAEIRANADVQEAYLGVPHAAAAPRAAAP
jgi:branched-chain amino acid transport system ATP-binding protein